MTAAGRQKNSWRSAIVQRVVGVGQTLPVTVPTALAAFSIIALAHLLIGQFRAILILPIGVVSALAAGYYAHRLAVQNTSRSKGRTGVIIDGLVLVGIILWAIFNLLFTSQHLFTNRDPATYNLAGAWLMQHRSVQIDKPAALQFLNVPGLTTDSLGFASSPTNSQVIDAQGLHVLPALQGLAGKMFGLSGVLKINVIFGATALLAFYGFARIIVKRNWAALATLIMALSLPMLFLVRDSYTEPLTMTFIFGGLSLLAYASHGLERWRWWLAGMVFGAAALARVDVYLAFAGLVMYVIILLMTAPRAHRRSTLSCASWLAIGMFIGGYLAWLDGEVLSTAYYNAHSEYIAPELYLLAFLLIVGAIAVLLNWRYNYVSQIDRYTTAWRDKLIFIIVGGYFLVLASRPVWFIGYQTNADGSVIRTFSEQTINWIVWYFGPVVMMAGVIGLAVIISRLLRGKDKQLWPVILMFSVTAALYLIKPSITGDQVWATRRFLPIMLPGVVLLSMWTLERLFDGKFGQRFRGRTYNTELIAAVLVTIAVVSPLFVTYPFSVRRLYVPELAQIQLICDSVPKNTIVIWAGEARNFATQPTRTLCGNDSLGLELADKTTNQQNLATLAKQAQQNNQNIMVGFFPDDAKLLPVNTSSNSLIRSAISYNEIEHTYKRAPRNMITINQKIILGKLDSTGTIN
jgi:hypothetical protein